MGPFPTRQIFNLSHILLLFLVLLNKKNSSKKTFLMYKIPTPLIFYNSEAVLIISSMRLMYWSDESWGRRNRFYSIRVECLVGRFVVLVFLLVWSVCWFGVVVVSLLIIHLKIKLAESSFCLKLENLKHSK